MADIQMPQLGETVTEGTITKWFKQVGDTVTVDEPLFEVSTDKVDTEVPSPIAGVLNEIRVAEGDTVDVGAVIAVVGEASASPAPPAEAAPEAAPEAAADPAPAPTPATEPAPEVAAEVAPAPAPAPEVAAEAAAPPAATPLAVADSGSTEAPAAVGSDNRLLSPVVRRLVAENGLNPSDISGTGNGGRITREDVLDHMDRLVRSVGAAPSAASSAPTSSASSTSGSSATALAAPVGTPAVVSTPPVPASQATAPSPPAVPRVAPGTRDSVVALSKIRRLTGDHMIMSKAAAPHALSVVEVDFANVDRARNASKAEWKTNEGFSLTYLPFISRAVIDALTEFPHLNASVSGDQLVVHNYVDLGIAVDLDYQGLLVPVVRSAESKRLRAIAREINDLAGRARSRKLSPDEINGGTFTISNNGSAGSVLTMPVINQPQVAILSTDAIVRKPVVVNGADGESIAIHPVGNLAMAWDHRAFDGAYAAGFLVAIKKALETRDWAAEL